MNCIMNRKYILKIILLNFVSVIAVLQNLYSQQMPFNTQYLINKFSLSPAFAGYTQNAEIFGGFRQDWVGLEGSPEFKNLNGSARKSDHVGLGANLSTTQTGIFKILSASASYAYHVEVSKAAQLSFGLSAGILNNRISFADIQSQNVNDPVAINFQDQHGTSFDATLGVDFYSNGLNIGLSVPHLIGNKIVMNKDQELNYTQSRHYLFYSSYYWSLDQKFSIEPWVIVRSTATSKLAYEASVLATYNDQIWLGIIYRKGSTIGLSIGGALGKKFVASYTYEFGGGELRSFGGATNEIHLGYMFKYSKNKAHPHSVFVIGEEDQIKLPDNKCCEANEKAIKKLERQISDLEKKLKTCCDDKKTDPALLDKIKNLELKIEELKLKSSQIQYKQPFIMKNIQYAYNSDQLEPSSYPELDKIFKQMDENPTLLMKITGYTDNVGKKEYNLMLSKKRAKAVKDYLVSKGIDEDRIFTDGKGSDDPIDTNSSEDGRAKNRRIEGSFSKE